MLLDPPIGNVQNRSGCHCDLVRHGGASETAGTHGFVIELQKWSRPNLTFLPQRRDQRTQSHLPLLLRHMKRAVFVARHGEREDYQWTHRGESWQAQAERPWDTPLTAAGHQQGRALGIGVAQHCDQLGLAPVTRIVSSPLIRCVQTANTAALSLGLDRGVGIEAGISETMCQHWYRSWAIPGANAKWGDRANEDFADEQLHPAALARASDATHRTAAEISIVDGIGPDGGRIKIDESYVSPHTGAFDFNWHHSETEAACKDRMKEVVERVYAAESEGSVLLVSHGGPTSNAFRALTGSEDVVRCCGFTGLFCYVKGGPGDAWEAPIVANSDHLKNVAGSRDGVNDAAEQSQSL